MSGGRDIISLISRQQDLDQFRKKTWIGPFEEYLDLVHANPRVTRNAFQRVYDMILSYGVDVYEPMRGEKRTHYRFFDDPEHHGQDAIYEYLRSIPCVDGELEEEVGRCF